MKTQAWGAVAAFSFAPAALFACSGAVEGRSAGDAGGNPTSDSGPAEPEGGGARTATRGGDAPGDALRDIGDGPPGEGAPTDATGGDVCEDPPPWTTCTATEDGRAMATHCFIAWRGRAGTRPGAAFAAWCDSKGGTIGTTCPTQNLIGCCQPRSGMRGGIDDENCTYSPDPPPRHETFASVHAYYQCVMAGDSWSLAPVGPPCDAAVPDD